jgi:hypothetical protein
LSFVDGHQFSSDNYSVEDGSATIIVHHRHRRCSARLLGQDHPLSRVMRRLERQAHPRVAFADPVQPITDDGDSAMVRSWLGDPHPRPRLQPCRLLIAECLTQRSRCRFRRVWRSGFVFHCRHPSSAGHQGCVGLERQSPLRRCGAVSAFLPSRTRQIPPNRLSVFSCRN